MCTHGRELGAINLAQYLPPDTWNLYWPPATGRPLWAAETTRFSCYSHDWVCVRVKLLFSVWKIWIGDWGRSPCAEKVVANFPTSRFPWMSVRRSPIPANGAAENTSSVRFFGAGSRRKLQGPASHRLPRQTCFWLRAGIHSQRMGPISSDTASPPRCFGREPHWLKIGELLPTFGGPRPQRSTPRSTLALYERWHCLAWVPMTGCARPPKIHRECATYWDQTTMRDRVSEFVSFLEKHKAFTPID